MLLVDDHQAEARELDRLLHERVRADDDARSSPLASRPRASRGAPTPVARPVSEPDREPRRREEPRPACARAARRGSRSAPSAPPAGRSRARPAPRASPPASCRSRRRPAAAGSSARAAAGRRRCRARAIFWPGVSVKRQQRARLLAQRVVDAVGVRLALGEARPASQQHAGLERRRTPRRSAACGAGLRNPFSASTSAPGGGWCDARQRLARATADRAGARTASGSAIGQIGRQRRQRLRHQRRAGSSASACRCARRSARCRR